MFTHHTEKTKEKLRKLALKQFKNGMPRETKNKCKEASVKQWKNMTVDQKKTRSEKIKKKLIGKKLSDKHKEEIRKTTLEYYKNNPDKKKIHAKYLLDASKTRWKRYKKDLRDGKYKYEELKNKAKTFLSNSKEMKEWKNKVLKRDNFKCVSCDSEIDLNIDHIKKFSFLIDEQKEIIENGEFEKLLKINSFWDINNGRTLCIDCHRMTFTFGPSRKIKQMNHRRQIDIFNPTLFNADITVIGLGTNGSNAVYCLARLGIKNIRVYDHDIVSSHNLASQQYFENDIGRSKTFCLAETLKRGLHTNIIYNQTKPKTKFDSNSIFLDDIVVIAVDTMKERIKIHDILAKSIFKPKLIIDSRMGGPQLEIYTCKTLEEWEDTFVDNPSKDSCGARSICYISMIIGSLIANQIKRFLKSESYKKMILFNINSLQLV